MATGCHPQTSQWRATLVASVRQHFHELKAAAERSIQQCQRAVRRVHGADHAYIRWNREVLVRIGQNDGLAAALAGALVQLDEGNELAEHFADVAPVDLVDDDGELLFWEQGRAVAKLLEDARADLVANASLALLLYHRA
ncbi:hypothetical protein D3C71_1312330 [compost metagenome]